MIALRECQIESLQVIRSNIMEGTRRQVVHLPTVAGKTGKNREK